MAGRAAGAQPRAPLLEGSDLSPANAAFWPGWQACTGWQGQPGTGDRGMLPAGREALVNKSYPQSAKYLQYGGMVKTKISMITFIKHQSVILSLQTQW